VKFYGNGMLFAVHGFGDDKNFPAVRLNAKNRTHKIFVELCG